MKGFLLPYIIFNLFSIILIFICLKRFQTGRLVFVILFISASFINFLIGLTNPEAYIKGFGHVAIPLYSRFIEGKFFLQYDRLFIALIATSQIIIAVFLSLEKKFLLTGVTGAVIFFVAISPLGPGSAFPSTIFLAVAIVILYKKSISK